MSQRQCTVQQRTTPSSAGSPEIVEIAITTAELCPRGPPHAPQTAEEAALPRWSVA
jgi:hypothetical protein